MKAENLISGMKMAKVDGNVASSDQFSHGLASSTGENKTNIQNPRDAEVSTVSSERVHSAQQTSIRSDFSSESGQPCNGKRKDPDSVTAEASCVNPTTKMPDHSKLLKTDSASSKESGEVVQLSSVDSTDPIPCQSNENLLEKKPCVTQSDESKVIFSERESSITTRSDSIAASMQSSRHYTFDLNEEDMEENGAEPISVVAKIGVPMGLPKKPLQFSGELGWRSSGNCSAFRPTSLKNPERDTCSIRGFDLNVAATMDSEPPVDKTAMDHASKHPERFLLDLNCQSENDEHHHKPVASRFDLNDNPMTEDTRKKNAAADPVTCSGGIVNPFIFDTRRPSYWVDLSSMRGFGHVQPQPFLVAAPTAEQVQMMVPSGLYIGKVNNITPTFYPHSVLPHLNSQHGAAAIPQIPGSVLAAYPGALHFIEGPQGLNPHAYANMRPTFFPNGSIPILESGSRGVSNTRNGMFEQRERPVEQVALPASQINNRQMAPWN